MNLKFWKRAPQVPLVRLGGMIAADSGGFRRGLNLETVAPLLQQAFDMPRAKAVALAINSPGGSPVQSSLIAARIRALATEKSLPVLAFVEDVAASGGYWLATAADEIFADEASVIGSIGVISAGFGFTEAMAKLGVERRVHTAGENKGILDPFQPERAEDVARLDGLLQELHDVFRAQVESRRGSKLAKDDADLFSGAFWTAGGALQRGLIDGIGHFRPILRQRFGDKVEIVPIRTKQPLFRRLTGGGFGAEGLADQAAALLDERLARQRYGG
jgi:signal peptide peptidase SppA